MGKLFKRISSLLLLPMLALTLHACSLSFSDEQEDATEGLFIPEYRYSGGTAATGFYLAYYPGAPLNPLTSLNRINLDLSSLCYEGLFALSSDFSALPSLCESFEVSGKVYTLRIKNNVLFHSGAPLTSVDVVYSLKQAKKSVLYAQRLKNVTAIEAKDDFTVRLTQAAEDGALPEKLDIPVIRSGEIDSDVPDGTGSYQMSSQPDGSCCLIPFEGNGASVPLSLISLKEISGTEDLVLSVESDDISLIRVNPFTPSPVSFFGTFETSSAATTNLHFLGINTRRPALSDSRVRRALSLLIDRDALSQQVFSGLGDAALIPCHPASAFYDFDAPRAEERREAAFSLLAEAGIRDSNGDMRLETRSGGRLVPFSLSILVNSDSAIKSDAAGFIAEILDSAGIDVTVSSMSFDKMLPYLEYSAFDLYYGETALMPDFDVSSLLLAGGAMNYSRYYNAELSKLCSAAQPMRGEERKSALREFYSLFFEESPFVPLLFTRSKIYMTPGKFLSFTPSPGHVYSGVSKWNIR